MLCRFGRSQTATETTFSLSVLRRSKRDSSARSRSPFWKAEETPEGKPWFRAVYADDLPVGFVMLSWNVTPDPPRIIGPWFLWRLLIDVQHQGCGYGREAVKLVADIARDNGAAELLTSYGRGEGGPEPFYRRIGFRPTGERAEKGEVIVALDLEAEHN